MAAEVLAVLFDLDGTLIDSAADLAGAANQMRVARGLTALPLAAFRPHCGSGARGMLAVAFQIGPDAPEYPACKAEFLDRYEACMLDSTQTFEAVLPVLDALDRHAVPWGIVTNKALRFAQPLGKALGLWPRSRTLVGGDSTPHTKPHPAPLLEAARQLAVSPSRCIYVGDDPRDMQAARAAGMRAAAAAWGYLGPTLPINDWGADRVLVQPDALLRWLDLA
jgi:phosphoglycolate phosphatase